MSRPDKKLEITPNTIISDLLKYYPELEDKLIEIAPVFKKLKNPILKKTIAKVTSLRQASVVGNITLSDLINTLRKEVGQDDAVLEKTNTSETITEPEWVNEERIKITYDAIEDLENGIHPMTKVIKDMNSLNLDEIYLLITSFVPLPLIDIMKEKGYDTFSIKVNNNQFKTYILKK